MGAFVGDPGGGPELAVLQRKEQGRQPVQRGLGAYHTRCPLSGEYRPQWSRFVHAILDGKDSAEALTSTYGKPLEAIEADLRSYVRGNRFLAGTFEGELEKINPQFPAEAAPRVRRKTDAAGLGQPEPEQRSRRRSYSSRSWPQRSHRVRSRTCNSGIWRGVAVPS